MELPEEKNVIECQRRRTDMEYSTGRKDRVYKP
jgi:hypothetical protein